MFVKEDTVLDTAMPYPTIADADRRLSDTVIMYDGEPYWVKDIGHFPSVLVMSLLTSKEIVVPINKLDLTSPALGYLPYRKGAVYTGWVSRSWHRQYRQGIHPTNLLYIRETDNTEPAQGGSSTKLDFWGNPGWQRLAGCILRKGYRNPIDIWKDINEHKITSDALSPDFAISSLQHPALGDAGPKRLRMAAATVGYISGPSETPRVCLCGGYEFLRGYLEDTFPELEIL